MKEILLYIVKILVFYMVYSAAGMAVLFLIHSVLKKLKVNKEGIILHVMFLSVPFFIFAGAVFYGVYENLGSGWKAYNIAYLFSLFYIISTVQKHVSSDAGSDNELTADIIAAIGYNGMFTIISFIIFSIWPQAAQFLFSDWYTLYGKLFI